MIRAVLDANVLVSAFPGLRNPASTPGELLRRWRRGEYELVVSEHILAELVRTYRKPYFAERYPAALVDRALAALRRRATVIPITTRVLGVATHPEDDPVLATAVSEQGTTGIYLVTGDGQLQKLRTHRRVVILSPREFLAVLAREAPQEVPSCP